MINFDIKSNLKRTAQAVAYLANAQKVLATTVSSGNRDLSKTQSSILAEEQSLLREKDNKINTISSTYTKLIKKEVDAQTEILRLSQKLISVDGKYAKTYNRIKFADGNEQIMQELESQFFGQDLLVRPLEKLVAYFKQESFKYLEKPAPKILIASKKRKNKYACLTSAVLLAERIITKNEQEYNKAKQDEIAQATEFYDLRIKELKSNSLSTLAKKEADLVGDASFLVEQASSDLSKIFNQDYYDSQFRIREAHSELKINLNLEFPNELYVGDMLSKSDVFSSNDEISKIFLQNHKTLFEGNVLISPWTMNLSQTSNLFISAKAGQSSYQLKQFINGFILSMLTQFPVNGVEFSVIDPEQKGNSVNPFLDMLKTMPDIFSKKIYTSAETICTRLQELNQYVDSVIQQKLSNKYENVLEYNRATPDNPLPYKLLCVFDFPKYFDARAYENLISIMRNGGKCGIITLICFNKLELRSTYGDTLGYIEEIKDCSVGIEQKGESFGVEKTNSSLFPIDLPKQEIIDLLCETYEKTSKARANVGIPFSTLVTENGLFSQNSAGGLAIPVGKGDGSAVQYIEIGGKSSHHAIITGATGSGKSTLLHTLIMSSVLNYSPDELNLYLMDFKSGTEFKIYETCQIPHIKLLALDALQEFGASILSELLEEQVRRSNLFKDNGDHKSIKSYVNATGNKMPRILVIMDEFQILFNENSNRKVAQQCAEMANKIVTEGRAFGIHLIMATQTLRSIREKTALSMSTIEQMRIRIGLKCGEEDASYIFGDTNARDALEKMKGAIGTAVYNCDYTESKNQGFRTAYCPDGEQVELLQRIAAQFSSSHNIETKIFEGRRIPQIPVENYSAKRDILLTNVEVELGEPIKVAPPVLLPFGKSRNGNLLIVGSDSQMQTKVSRLVAIGIVSNLQTRLHYVDGNSFFDEPSDSMITSLERLSPERFNRVTTRKDCLLTIESISEEIKKRKRNASEDKTRIFLMIDGLQCVDILCSAFKGDTINRSDYIEDEGGGEAQEAETWDFSSSSRSASSYDTMLKEIAESGYTYGINLIITCNEYSTVKDVLHYGAGIMNKLPVRIVFSISDNDCGDLIDGAKASELNNTTVLFSNGIKDIYQFKPYEITSQEQIDKIFS